MLEFVECDIEDTLAWRISGQITEADMRRALEALRERLQRFEKVCVYQEIESIGGAELDAMLEKLRFLREFGISNFRKVAVVTDKRWLQKVISLEDALFSSVQMRAFGSDERERAMNFLAYGDAPAAT